MNLTLKQQHQKNITGKNKKNCCIFEKDYLFQSMDLSHISRHVAAHIKSFDNTRPITLALFYDSNVDLAV